MIKKPIIAVIFFVSLVMIVVGIVIFAPGLECLRYRMPSFEKSEVKTREVPKPEIKEYVSPSKRSKIIAVIGSDAATQYYYLYNTGKKVQIKTRYTHEDSSGYADFYWSPDENHFAKKYSRGLHSEYLSVFKVGKGAVTEMKGFHGGVSPKWGYSCVDWFFWSKINKWLDNNRLMWVDSQEHHLYGSEWIYAYAGAKMLYSARTDSSKVLDCREIIQIRRALTKEQVRKLSGYVSGLRKQDSFKRVNPNEYEVIAKQHLSQSEMDQIIKLTGHVITEGSISSPTKK